MQPAVSKLQAVLSEVSFSSPRLPVISNVDAKPHFDPQEIKDILARQVTSPVQWETIITAMVQSPDFAKSYEFGPGTTFQVCLFDSEVFRVKSVCFMSAM
jgi:[acyl-carrier-protein] S-malonyltransferase